jgi:hypothetical protein
MDAYLDEWQRGFEEAWLEQRRNPHPGIKLLLEIKARLETGKESQSRL